MNQGVKGGGGVQAWDLSGHTKPSQLVILNYSSFQRLATTQCNLGGHPQPSCHLGALLLCFFFPGNYAMEGLLSQQLIPRDDPELPLYPQDKVERSAESLL